MKLDWISTISEITPYLGELDDTFRLMRRLNRCTSDMWEKTWVKLTKNIKRKLIYFELESMKILDDFHWRILLVLSLFRTTPILITSNYQYRWLIKLLKNFENPKMMQIQLYLSLEDNKSIQMRLTDYKKYIDQVDNSYLKMYNKVVQHIIDTDFDISFVESFAFINKAWHLSDVKYIKHILFPCNKESDTESMLNAWKEFIDSNKFNYKNVILIWDDMEYAKFMQIYNVLMKQNIEIQIVSTKKLNELAKVIGISFNFLKNNVTIKMGDDEFIVFDWSQNSSKVELNHWYYKAYKYSSYEFNITNAIIKYKDQNLIIHPVYSQVDQGVINSLTF